MRNLCKTSQFLSNNIPAAPYIVATVIEMPSYNIHWNNVLTNSLQFNATCYYQHKWCKAIQCLQRSLIHNILQYAHARRGSDVTMSSKFLRSSSHYHTQFRQTLMHIETILVAINNHIPLSWFIWTDSKCEHNDFPNTLTISSENTYNLSISLLTIVTDKFRDKVVDSKLMSLD